MKEKYLEEHILQPERTTFLCIRPWQQISTESTVMTWLKDSLSWTDEIEKFLNKVTYFTMKKYTRVQQSSQHL